jgi:hypothetical protein
MVTDSAVVSAPDPVGREAVAGWGQAAPTHPVVRSPRCFSLLTRSLIIIFVSQEVYQRPKTLIIETADQGNAASTFDRKQAGLLITFSATLKS